MYSKKDVALTADSVTAVVELKATSSAVVREGLDLVAVVDVSGSMGGHKIESVKRALQFVIMKLTPVDRLSIVTFSSSAKRLNPLLSMTPAAQDKLKGDVGKLIAGGGTDIKAGLSWGLAVVAGRVHKESRTANIFLMSDGKVEGGDDPTKTDPGEVPVYTLVLSTIAMKSIGGTYSSVPDGTNLSMPFAQLLGGLLTVVAQDVRLTLTPKTADGDLDKMVVVPGTDYTQTTDAQRHHHHQTRKVAVNFTLKASSDTRPYNATLAVARHSYAAEETRQPPPPPPASEEQWVHAELGRRSYVAFVSEANSMAEEATGMANQAAKAKDDAKMAEAWRKLEAAQQKLEDAQDAVENIMLDDGNKMVNTLRAELAQLVEYMQSHELYDEFGRPYALATITSHCRQRAAGRGDMEILCLYVTPRMITYVQQAKKFEENPKEPVPCADEDVKKEVAENPLAGIAASLSFYLDNAIQALQAIEKIVSTASST
ncbi:hypothetical protein HU200_063414 [Digitaria exilis]|uniref:VWFA domain-containing protein n=1 Tax=Digitaria exilis TaxID=1010633 RepID=A0A835DZ50_9POAL|nr:hypothetical protein HU200_063414 [Digitaria exilis]